MSSRRLAIALTAVSAFIIATSAAFIVDASASTSSTHPWSEAPMHDYLFKETK